MMRQRNNKGPDSPTASVTSTYSDEKSLDDSLVNSAEPNGTSDVQDKQKLNYFSKNRSIICSLPALLLLSIVVHLAISWHYDGLDALLSTRGTTTMRSGGRHRRRRLPQSAGGNPNRRHQTIRTFAKCPPTHCKKYFVRPGPNHHVVRRALNSKGWQRVSTPAMAQLIYAKGPRPRIQENLKPWQRFNHHEDSENWNQKDTFAAIMMDYYRKEGGRQPNYIPDTYNLENNKERRQFQQILKRGGGISVPWVLKKPTVNNSKGITMLGPNTKKLANVLQTVDESNEPHIIQRYICNEMTFYGRKMDFRVWWMVASFDPLIVMYHDGFLRIGNSNYSEQDFSNTQKHLTTNTNLSAERKGSWQDLEELVREHGAKHRIRNPMQHVRNQLKHSVAQMAAAFAESTFHTKTMKSENAYGIFGADFILDNDLDVWFIEPQRGPAINEAWMFKQEQNNIIFPEMVGIVDEIIEKQAAGLPLMPLKEQKHYEIVYEDGWLFEYKGYQRAQNKKGCQIPSSQGREEEEEEEESGGGGEGEEYDDDGAADGQE